ncbi:MAG: alpha/beta hydrolase [Phycisphaeraceae bacterium]|nr:alpha/beta hydrolase [Phycisphaeraceae bacterium]
MRRCGHMLAAAAMVLGWTIAAVADEPAPTPPMVSQIEQRADAVLSLWPVDPAPLKPEVTQESVTYRTSKDGQINRVIFDIAHPTLTVFLPGQPDAKRPAIVICPGGGYRGVVIDREGFRIADRLSRAGMACFVLKYRLPVGVTPGADQLPPPIQDVQRAIRLVRSEAEKWNIDPARIGVIGFSAGGHLAGMAATLYEERDASVNDPQADVSCRPDFAALMYAVASMHADIAHMGSRNNLIGESASVEIEDRFSTAQRITPDAPPLFICHAKDDAAVPIANSVGIAAAADEVGVEYLFLPFEVGGHGFSTGSAETGTDVWIDQFLSWLREGGFLAGTLSPKARRLVSLKMR